MKKPDFIIIGAQKAGTSWLWHMLDQHPDTDLPEQKEIHYFGSVELHRQGKEWYFEHFRNVNPEKLTGEASTTYLYDYVPYFQNQSSQIEFDESLASLPELILEEMPDVKIIISLRDPVKRAISAYHHWIQHDRSMGLPPFRGLIKTATEEPKTRIVEYGYYAKYIKHWKNYVDSERIFVTIFEEDVLINPGKNLSQIFRFLNIDPDFQPAKADKKVNKSWSWTRIVASYYTQFYPRLITTSFVGRLCDKYDVLGNYAITENDIEFLRSKYLPEKAQLEELLSRKLDCWKYGL